MFNNLIPTTMKLQFGELVITPRVEERLEELGYTAEELQEAVNEHKSELDGNPSAYVGTYFKYNEGSLYGLWIDLTSFYTYSDFINFCKAIHADESDPELMQQDYENYPRDWYSEGFMSEEEFKNIQEYSELCEEFSKEAVDAFMDWGSEPLYRFKECYMGEWDSEEDFAEHLVSEVYDVERNMGHLANYFDYARYARELFECGDYHYDNGFVFRPY